MPISIDDFEDVEGEPLRTSDRILQFLLTHEDEAYTRSEIADAIDVTPETVGTNLSRLKDRNLVRHRPPYWACADDKDAVRERLPTRRPIDDEQHGEDAHSKFTTGDEADRATAETASRESLEGESDIADGPGDSAAVRPAENQHRAAATEFFDRVRDELADELAALYLFGSVAQEEPTASSDVDVLAVIAADAEYRTVDDRLLDIAYDVQLDRGVRIEVHTTGADEFDSRTEAGDPFVESILQDGERVV